eukprot:TRINITY_DN7152_c0_g1_i1.p1 TRINITY_DN7152_c0_g1~~TRINITY_DN7152_c0_g1_i1.p1  ORF type:complete len:121 (-),score=4.61 TRINITY_DN7152_c0_g1_i1:83-445(-)
MVIKSFKVCGISSALDGSEDEKITFEFILFLSVKNSKMGKIRFFVLMLRVEFFAFYQSRPDTNSSKMLAFCLLFFSWCYVNWFKFTKLIIFIKKRTDTTLWTFNTVIIFLNSALCSIYLD